jgi:hypothetical protein
MHRRVNGAGIQLRLSIHGSGGKIMNVLKRLAQVCLLVVLASAPASIVTAQGGAPHSTASKAVSKIDLAAIRNATQRFQDVNVAEEEGYSQFLGCVSGSNGGAMGIHFANGDLVDDPALDPLMPEVLIYEPNGDRLTLVGMEYVVIAEAWHANNEMPPVMMGQSFHYAPSPNRYGMPPHYQLHIWAWRHNTNGTFADWNPQVSCDKMVRATISGQSSKQHQQWPQLRME